MSTKHDDLCPCTRFRAQDEFCTCGAVGRAEIVKETAESFGKRLSEIMHEHSFETHGPSGIRICECGTPERKAMTYETAIRALNEAAHAAIRACKDTVQYPMVDRQTLREIAAQTDRLVGEHVEPTKDNSHD